MSNKEKIIIKDKVTFNLYKQRDKLLEYLIDTYELKKKYCRILIIIYNMERIHFGSMINKVEDVKELNNIQCTEKHSNDREKEIIKKLNGLENPDWSESEKKTLDGYHNDLNTISKKFGENVKEIIKIQKTLHDHKGEETIISITTS